MTLKEYALLLLNYIPINLYIATLSILIVISLVYFGLHGLGKGMQCLFNLLLCEYIFILLGTTVLFRETRTEIQFEISPFWSYSIPDLLIENVMNILAFIPVGFLLGLANKNLKWGVMIVGICLSVTIEVLQLVLKKGLCEIDDVIHNTLGCLIGLCMLSVIRKFSVYLRS